MLKSKATLVGFCVCCCLGLKAQDCHYALRGHVVESQTNEPLAFANVFVKEIGKGIATDEQGWFAIPNLCENTPYTVEIRHIGCAHFVQIVRLTENVQMDFQLNHDAVLDEVVVREKAIAPVATNAELTVNQADLEAAKGLNLSETLRKLPGVSILSSGATIGKPVIQGLHSNRIAIVSDGVTLQSQQWGNDHAPEIDPFTADKITVVKGAAGVRYGVGAMAGAIVLEPAPLREKAGANGWLTLGGWSNGRGGVAAGSLDWRPQNSSLAFRLQGTLKRSGNLRAPDYWLGNTGVSEFNFSAMTDWKRKRWHHTISATQFGQSFGILRAAHTGSLDDLRASIASDTPRNNLNYFTYQIDRPQQRVQHNTLKYKAELQLNDLWRLTGQYSFQYNQRREYDRGRGSITAGDKAQVTFQLWSNSLDVALQHRPIHHWQGAGGIQATQQLNYVSRGGFIPDYVEIGGGAWATERWRRYPVPWEWELGARYDFRWNHASTTGNGSNNLDQRLQFGNVSGTAGGIYHFSPMLTAKMNTGYAWRPPHVNELFARGIHHGTGTYEQGNPSLQPEKAWNTNLTLDWQTLRFQATLTAYRNQVQDFIYLNQPRDSFVLTIRGPFPAYFYQQADAVLQGTDANFSVAALPRWWLEGQVALLWGCRSGNGADGGNHAAAKHDWLPLLPADRYQYGVRWVFAGEQAGKKENFVRLLATTVLRQKRIPAEGLTAPAPAAFTTLGIEAAQHFHFSFFKHEYPLEVGLTVQNLTNTRYREYLDFFRFYADAPGLNVGLRAKMSFGQ